MADRDEVDVIIDQWAVERPELETDAMEIFGRIYRIARAMGDRMERAYSEFGIGRAEFDVLGTLRRSGPPFDLSPTQLASAMMLTTGGMTGRLDKLERAGLLERLPDPTDRRALRARLTPKGRAVIDDAVGAGLEVQRAALADLSPADRASLAAALRTLLAASHESR